MPFAIDDVMLQPIKMMATAPPIFMAHGDVEQWQAAAVNDIVAGLDAGLHARGQARLLVSGGSTPAPVYRTLSRQRIPWQHIEIGLIDERWLPIGDPDSNATLIRKTLLAEQAIFANFHSLRLPHNTIYESTAIANKETSAASVAVLGMGSDGHTASLFSKAINFNHILASKDDYVAVDATDCPGAAPWPHRISLTPAGLAKTDVRLLLIRGAQKRALLEHALAGTDPLEFPIRAVFSLPGAPLLIHWCP